jgi:hypothetical protein
MTFLSQDELIRYQQRGYLIPPFQLTRAHVDALCLTPEKLVSAHIEGQNDEGVRGSKDFLDLAKPASVSIGPPYRCGFCAAKTAPAEMIFRWDIVPRPSLCAARLDAANF